MDGQTKADYGRNLAANLSDLHQRLKQGRYRASPVKRVWLDEPDGGKRPIGLPTLEDKIVQSAVVNVLNAIYECDFHGLSYGFRPGRNQHQALQAVQTFLQKGRVNWVLDLDLKACFDTIEHEALMEAVQRRVTDRTILRLIRKWLTVGVVEDGKRERACRGSPQGAVISPLLANIVLHYAMDEVVTKWRRTEATGELYCVRYADDAVLAFEHEADAHALKARLEESLADYGLALNQTKTRMIRFGRHWPERGIKPETFDFLGFTHIVGKDRKGRSWFSARPRASVFGATCSTFGSGCANTVTGLCNGNGTSSASISPATTSTTASAATTGPWPGIAGGCGSYGINPRGVAARSPTDNG